MENNNQERLEVGEVNDKSYASDNVPSKQNEQLEPAFSQPKKSKSMIIALVLAGVFIFSGMVYGAWYGYIKYLAMPKLETLLYDSISQARNLKSYRVDFDLNIEVNNINDVDTTTDEPSLNMLSGILGYTQKQTFNFKGYQIIDRTNPDLVKTEGAYGLSGPIAFGKFGLTTKALDKNVYVQVTDFPTFASMFFDVDKLKGKWVKFDQSESDDLLKKYSDNFSKELSDPEKDLRNFQKAFEGKEIFAELEKCQKQEVGNEKLIVCKFKINSANLKEAIDDFAEISKSEGNNPLAKIENSDWEKISAYLNDFTFEVSFRNSDHLISNFIAFYESKDKEVSKSVLEVSIIDINKEQNIVAPAESVSFNDIMKELFSGSNLMSNGLIDNKLEESEVKARDVKRLSDIKQIQTVLELFYNENSHYPIVESEEKLGEGNYACLDNNGFNSLDNCKDFMLMRQIPIDPTMNAFYSYVSKDGKDYQVSFSLEGESFGYKPGFLMASSEGIKQVSVNSVSVNNNLDSDSDGLSDTEEINKYGTDLTKSDSDGDGYSDGDEVKNGYNPNGDGKLAE